MIQISRPTGPPGLIAENRESQLDEFQTRYSGPVGRLREELCCCLRLRVHSVGVRSSAELYLFLQYSQLAKEMALKHRDLDKAKPCYLLFFIQKPPPSFLE
jgi:hypothetical protein